MSDYQEVMIIKNRLQLMRMLLVAARITMVIILGEAEALTEDEEEEETTMVTLPEELEFLTHHAYNVKILEMANTPNNVRQPKIDRFRQSTTLL